ncbi:MAG TPA: M1 family aminopeptidase [Patescibacteria group bacterium]|nr:M1 family aminopeptidase [Patescibacteria group bacterium]
MKTLFITASLLALLSLNATAQVLTATHVYEPGSEPRERVLDIENMRVEVSFKEREGRVLGRVTHRFSPLRKSVDSIFFDAPGITIKKVLLNGRDIVFKTDSLGVNVFPKPALSWGSRDSIVFEYEATPHKGIYFIGWNDAKNISRKQIWTQGQQFDNRYWIPMYDDANDKMMTETIVTFLKEYQVLSNGLLLKEKDNGNGTKTWHYAMTKPHTGYLLMLGIGKYAIDKRKSASGVPLNLWYYPEFPSHVEPMYRYSTEAMDFLEAELGVPYPWETYAQIPVQDYMSGAMENTTATVFGDFYHTDARAFLDRNYIGTNVHELTHQWFGDYVTARHTKHQWLQESFATFYPKLFKRKYFGEDDYQWERRSEHNQALAASRRDSLPIVHTRSGQARIYPKGSAVLDMMMYTFGEDEYRRVITHFLKKFPYKTVETHDLYHSFQDTLGLTPDWFFDQWLYRGGEPHYEVHYNTMTPGQTTVSVSQVHRTDELIRLFSMPIVIEAHYADGTKTSQRIKINEKEHSISIPNPGDKPVAFVLFDPGSYVLKNITFKKQPSELKEQVLKAPNMIDRYDALLTLRTDSIPLEDKRDVLRAVYDKESFPQLRAEAVYQLLKDSSDAGLAFIRRAIRDPHADVRRTVINFLPTLYKPLQSDLETLLNDSSYSIVETAVQRLTWNFRDDASRYLEMTENDNGQNNRILIKRLHIKSWYGDKTALRNLIHMASSSFEFRTRQAAIDALKQLAYIDDAVADNLLDAAAHFNRRLAGTGADAIKLLIEGNTANRERFQKRFEARSWSDWQRDSLQKLLQ